MEEIIKPQVIVLKVESGGYLFTPKTGVYRINGELLEVGYNSKKIKPDTPLHIGGDTIPTIQKIENTSLLSHYLYTGGCGEIPARMSPVEFADLNRKFKDTAIYNDVHESWEWSGEHFVDQVRSLRLNRFSKAFYESITRVTADFEVIVKQAPKEDHPGIHALWRTKNECTGLCFFNPSMRLLFKEVAEELGVTQLPDGTHYSKTNGLNFSFKDRGDDLEYTTGFGGYLYSSREGSSPRYTGTFEECLKREADIKQRIRNKLTRSIAKLDTVALTDESRGFIITELDSILSSLQRVTPHRKHSSSFSGTKRRLGNLITNLINKTEQDGE